MKFKRKEGFRFTFNEPIEAFYTVLVDNQPLNQGCKRTCNLLDVSPKGLKMYTDMNLTHVNEQLLQVELSFKLDEKEIKGIGEIIWSKNVGNGYYYGVSFSNQQNIEHTIVCELKSRRRKEVNAQKHV